MKAKLLVVPTLLSVCLSQPAWCAENVAYSKVRWSGISAHVVSINLNSHDLKVTVSLARRGRGSSESFSSMINRAKPTAAITGTFFCTRSLLPTGDIVIENTAIHTGVIGTGVCITPDNTVEFVPYSIGHKKKWQGYETVLCAGPTLVRNGSVYLIPRDQGFRDPSLFGNKRRTAVGATASNKLLFVTIDTPVQLRTLAKMMMHLGATNAVAMDGGSSTALHCNGKTVSRPGRSLTNLLVVYNNLNSYEKNRTALAPALRRTQIATADAPARLTETLMSQAAQTRLPQLRTGMTVLPTMDMSRFIQDAQLGMTEMELPVTNTDPLEPVFPEVEAILNTGSKTGNAFAALTTAPVRRAQREQSIAMTNRLLVH